MTVSSVRRRWTAGVELQADGLAHARVWAPACRRIDVVLEQAAGSSREVALTPEEGGFFSGALRDVGTGDRYWLRLDGHLLRPDPASRFQPEGPHGPSVIIDPSRYRWSDQEWAGPSREGQVIYEMHVGTFTPEGTWAAAAARLDHLVELGVTMIEMMPVADFAGRFGWGYDGVNLYAPTRLYGTPDDLRAFIDRAHGLRLAVILDVVYNHLGPDGNYLAEFSPEYFTDKYKNDWGQALNFEGPEPARAYFVENAAYWIEEFHFDGLRLDATQDMYDASAEHVIREIARSARQAAAPRQTFLVAENEPQDTKLIRPAASGGYGLDAAWNDDYHHCALVALTGVREAYYVDYGGTAQELVSCAKHGFLYQGQWYAWQKKRRGTPSRDLDGPAFVTYLENHDQVANTPFGWRLHQVTSPGRYRALTALTLLGPATPMLFQGQEFGSSAPFVFFADHREELRGPIRRGRREFLSQFPRLTDPEIQAALPAPDSPDTFHRCKLDFGERERHREVFGLHRDLLAIRRSDPAIAAAATRRPDGAVLSRDAFVLRYDGGGDNDRLLVVNLGPDLDLAPISQPLMAPPPGSQWTLLWSSEAVRYGGLGRAPLHPHPAWRIPGEACVLLRLELLSPDEDDAGDS